MINLGRYRYGSRRIAAHRLIALSAVLVLTIAACGGGADDAGTNTDTSDSADTVSDSNTDTSDGGETGAVATLGWIVTGPAGTEFEFTETITANGADTVNSYSYSLEAQPRQGLYTQFVDAATIEVSVTSGGPVAVQLVFGTVGTDGSTVNVVSVIETQEATTGETATVSGRLDARG